MISHVITDLVVSDHHGRGRLRGSPQCGGGGGRGRVVDDEGGELRTGQKYFSKLKIFQLDGNDWPGRQGAGGESWGGRQRLTLLSQQAALATVVTVNVPEENRNLSLQSQFTITANNDNFNEEEIWWSSSRSYHACTRWWETNYGA